jgi:hypothetical protein
MFTQNFPPLETIKALKSEEKNITMPMIPIHNISFLALC